MSLADFVKPAQPSLTARFVLTGLLPTVVYSMFVASILAAGAPVDSFSPHRMWVRLSALQPGQILLTGVVIIVLAILLAPVQTTLVRLIEGGWPAWLGPGPARRRQRRRRARAAHRAALVVPSDGGAPADDEVQRAGAAQVALDRRYPRRDALLRETTLGNVLAAMNDTAGRSYGIDAAVTWPRLYPLLSPAVRAIVDARRDALDSATRLAVTGAPAGVLSGVLLSRSGWWLLLAVLPLLGSWLAYTSAVQAALGYAEAVHAAYDLHRFDLLRKLHLPLPEDRAAEVTLHTALGGLWRQRIPFDTAYRHDAEDD